MARKIFMDFETRSWVNIKDVGAPKYAAHPSTQPLMLVYGNDAGHEQWVLDLSAPEATPRVPETLAALIEDPEVDFHAHNAGFEIAIWDAICVGRWGWPAIAHDRWHCTAGRAAAANQPRALGSVGNRLGLSDNHKKETRGKELIKALCGPTKCQVTYRKARKDADGNTVKHEITGRITYDVNKKSARYLEEQGIQTFNLLNKKGKTYTYFFNEDRKLMREFLAYNRQDIVAEREVHKRLPPSHPNTSWSGRCGSLT
jgi:DNA polymerase